MTPNCPEKRTNQLAVWRDLASDDRTARDSHPRADRPGKLLSILEGSSSFVRNRRTI